MDKNSEQAQAGPDSVRTGEAGASGAPQALPRNPYRLDEEAEALLPCVLYQADRSLKLSYISDNIRELIGVESRVAVDNGFFWDRSVFPEDLELFAAKVEELQVSGAGAFIHRMRSAAGLPVWVAHRFRSLRTDRSDVVLGSLVSLDHDPKVHGIESSTISRFVHKIGNQFQLIALSVGSIAKTRENSKDMRVFQEAVDGAIELVRTLSEYNQIPACLPDANLGEIVKASVASRRRSFEKQGIALEETIEASIDDVSLAADPFLLEAAIGHVLQNALEASRRGGAVAVVASLLPGATGGMVAKLCVEDTGAGIAPDDLMRVTRPFFTSKKNHEGLGLSLACRFVELHGGALRIRSAVQAGTTVEILLPVKPAKRDAL
ncbi:MAG TPA: ATP-binding protein [Candidatus Eisenbacteria bacterium]|nr:ATP-binding protein [Candidatus Eisenbacteria bacterium]